MIYFLDFRTTPSGGAVKAPGLSLRGDKTVKNGAQDMLLIEEKVTFLIHGFNVNGAEGRASLGRLADELLKTVGGAMICVLWPGDSFVGPLGYSWQGSDADDTARYLAKFMEETWPDNSYRDSPPVSFVAHSKGARVAMEAASLWAEKTGRMPVEICLMAAAIDDTSLANCDVYRAVSEGSSRVSVLYSKQDSVLSIAYPLGDLLQAFLFSSDIAGCALGYGGPKGLPGNQNLPPSILSLRIEKNLDMGHGDYLPPCIQGADLSQKQASTAAFVCDALNRQEDLTYT